jgi:hypothetical protein
MRRVDGIVQLVLACVLITGVVWTARPAGLDTPAAGHNPTTCEVCRHPNSQRPGAGDAEHGLAVGAERHLRLCRTCREAGLTPERLLTQATPTPCLASR